MCIQRAWHTARGLGPNKPRRRRPQSAKHARALKARVRAPPGRPRVSADGLKSRTCARWHDMLSEKIHDRAWHCLRRLRVPARVPCSRPLPRRP
eukprot:618762-Prymnesium_polylepis.1